MNYAKYLIINMKVVENFIMDYKDKKNLPVDKYEYELLGKSVHSSSESMGESFFTQPSSLDSDIKPLDPNQKIEFATLRPWYIACTFVLVLGLIFEFGILGKNGKQGPLCRYMPKNKVCYVLAGPGSSLEK